MRYRLCLVALTIALGLAIAGPATVHATNTTTEESDKRGLGRGKEDQKYQAALDKWNKLTDAQKQEVYTILKNKQKADLEVLNKLVQLGVLDKEDALAMQLGLQKIYNEMMNKGQFPIMRPRSPKLD